MTAAAPLNPMAFAAMMMGFPVGGAVEDPGQEDLTAFLDDVDATDPDYEELIAEFRPRLRERFEGWAKLVERSKDPAAPVLLNKMYNRIVELMPFMRGADVVSHMVLQYVFHVYPLCLLTHSRNRLNELPGKAYIARALEAMSSFCTIQRKRCINALKQKRTNEKVAAGSQIPSASFSFPFHTSPILHPPPGGMEDVD